MGERIFFLNRLKDGVSREQGDRFLLERDIPMSRAVPSITSYSVSRLHGSVVDDRGIPFDYLDVIEVTSVEAYRADIARLEGTDEWEAFVAEWNAHVDAGRSLAVYGSELR